MPVSTLPRWFSDGLVAPGWEPGVRCQRVGACLAPVTLLACAQLATAAPLLTASSPAPPSPASLAAQRRQAEQALAHGDLRRGCPLLRRAMDGTGALLARSPSRTLETELRAMAKRLQPCIRKGL